LTAETVALAHPGAAVLRVAAVYGARVKGNYARLIGAIDRGRFITVGSAQNRRTLVYDEDLASAAWLAAIDRRSQRRIYNVTDGHVHTIAEIVTAISEAMGKPASVWHLPVAPARLLAAVLEQGCSVLGARPPVTVAMIDKLQEDLAVAGARIREELGFHPAFDLRRGWTHALPPPEQQAGPA
jgi:UDP-glucose 4-epimerase